MLRIKLPACLASERRPSSFNNTEDISRTYHSADAPPLADMQILSGRDAMHSHLLSPRGLAIVHAREACQDGRKGRRTAGSRDSVIWRPSQQKPATTRTSGRFTSRGLKILHTLCLRGKFRKTSARAVIRKIRVERPSLKLETVQTSFTAEETR